MIAGSDTTSMPMKGFSYAMIAAFAVGLALTILGSAQVMLSL